MRITKKTSSNLDIAQVISKINKRQQQQQSSINNQYESGSKKDKIQKSFLLEKETLINGDPIKVQLVKNNPNKKVYSTKTIDYKTFYKQGMLNKPNINDNNNLNYITKKSTNNIQRQNYKISTESNDNNFHKTKAYNDQTNKLGSTAAVVISGIWNYQNAVKALGDRLGCAEMPSFTVDGQTYHISSFSGYKLIGFKPQRDAKKLSVCRKIARYLTNQESQMSGFGEVGWGPSNTIASQSEKVLAQPGLKALFDQSKYAQEQGICPGSWWSNVSTLAGQIKPDTTDAQFTEYLRIYDSNLDGLLDD